MNNVTAPSDFSGEGGSNNVVGSGFEEYSDTNWELICFMILWLIAFSMLTITIFSYGKSTGRRASIASRETGPTDEENQTKQDTTETPTEVAQQGRAPTGILTVLAAAIGFSLSLVAQNSCRYINSGEIRLPNNHEIDYFGLWSAAIYDGTYGSNDVCRSTFRNEFPVDTPMKVARYAAVLASVMGSIALLCTFYFALSKRLDSVWFGRQSWSFLVSALAQALVLVVVSTDLCDGASDNCSLDLGGVASITASAYWVIAALGVASTSSLVVSS